MVFRKIYEPKMNGGKGTGGGYIRSCTIYTPHQIYIG
jgi:hypothetical protein